MERMKGNKPPPVRVTKRSYEAFHDLQALSATDPLGGAIINNRYEIVGRIGQGGMAHIYLAIDNESHTRVAVKILSDNPERSDELTERFFVEARAAAKISHPNVIEIKDIGTFKDKTFCVMEYLEGRDLSTYLVKKEGMRWKQAAGILAQVCDALEAAHGKGVIHRDMKPENIMLIPRDGAELVKVLDFGLAKLTDSAERLTRENIVLGTPTYMAPEQAWSRDYDRRVDIYALGVIAYEILCGTPPFKSDIPDDKARTLQVLLMHKEKAPQPMAQRNPGIRIPEGVEAAIMRALEKDPAKRFQSAREMKEALLAEPPVRSREASRQSTAAEGAAWEKTGEHGGEGGGKMSPWSLPPEERSFGRSFGRAFRKVSIIFLVTAAIGLPAYHYRDRISEFIGEAKERLRGERAGEPPRLEPMAAPTNNTQTSSSYRAKIESTPRGATVLDVTGGTGKRKVLGRTPLDVTFQNWENELLITKPGYYPVRLVVTGSEPEQSVTLRAIPREADAPATGGAGSSGEEQPRDGTESNSAGRDGNE